jgi:hypothetical protein
MNKIISFLFILLCSQTNAQIASKAEMVWHEDSLVILSNKILAGESDSVRILANSQFHSLLKQALSFDNAIEYPFSKLPAISKLEDADKNFKILNWSLRFDDGRFKYFAFMLYRTKEGVTMQEWIDTSVETREFPDQEVFGNDNWYGAYYYKLIEKKNKLKKRQYLLLGWDGYEFDSNQKIIEVLNIDKEGIVTFGAPILEMKEETKHRFFLRFKEDAVVTLRYFEEQEQIVFDHLIPMQRIMEGVYQFYVSDFSYDGFQFSNWKWEFIEQIDARNQNDNTKKPKKIERRLFRD